MADLIEEGRRLYTVVVQDLGSGQVLMVAFADDRALEATRTTKLAHFYSRSRRALWKKGETSGHLLPVEQIVKDCDGDSYLYLSRPVHPVCHRNTPTCFDGAPRGFPASPDILGLLAEWIHERALGPSDPQSYTQGLLRSKPDRLLKKIAEDAGEVIIAALSPGENQDRELVWESADLLFHLALVWERLGISPSDIATELLRRHTPALPDA